MNPHTVIFTTAPKDYDYWYTQEVKAEAGKDVRGRIVREVHVDSESHAEIQRDRYYAGAIYLVADTETWNNLVTAGIYTVTQ